MKAVHRPGLAAIIGIDDDAEYAEAFNSAQPGQFEIETSAKGQRRFWFVCPGPCKTIAPIALRPVVDGSSQSWDFDGNMEAPTLHPSINHVGCWHGWLKAGEFTSC